MENDISKQSKRNVYELLLKEQIKTANNHIEFLELHIKMQKMYLRLLKNRKTYWFQRKRKNDYSKKIQKAEKEIKIYYNKINEELKDIYEIDNLIRENN